MDSSLKCLIIGFDPLALNKDILATFIDGRREILNWLYFLFGSLAVVTRKQPQEVAQLLRDQFPNQYLFVTYIDPSRIDGWLPQTVWDFLAKPKGSGKWPDLGPLSQEEMRSAIQALLLKTPQPPPLPPLPPVSGPEGPAADTPRRYGGHFEPPRPKK